MKTLSLLTLSSALLLQATFAGGEIAWDEVKSRISKSDPGLIQVIEDSFAVDKIGAGVRLGPSFGERQNEVIPPYEFEVENIKTKRREVLVIQESEDHALSGRFRFLQRSERRKDSTISPASGSTTPDPINAQRSPFLRPVGPPELEAYIRNTYGGVTGLVLDLDQIGTDRMVYLRFSDRKEMTPWGIDTYRLLSDKITEDAERGVKERTVILIDDLRASETGRKDIICYKITSQTRMDQEGRTLNSESVYHSLTLSIVWNEYEFSNQTIFQPPLPHENLPAFIMPPEATTSAASPPSPEETGK